MKLNQKIGLVFFFLLFLLPSTFAAQTTVNYNYISVQDSDVGLQILYPNKPYHELGVDLDLYFHVFNSSSVLLPVDEVTCVFHLYDSDTNKHILEIVPSTHDDIEFEIELNTSLISKEGAYEFNFWCNWTEPQGDLLEAGFVSDGFMVNESGHEDKDPAFLFALIFVPLMLAFILLVGSATMHEDHTILRIFMFLLSFAGIITSLWFGLIIVVKYYNLFELQEAIGTTAFWFAWVYFALIAYFIFYATFKTKEYFFNKKKEKENLEY